MTSTDTQGISDEQIDALTMTKWGGQHGSMRLAFREYARAVLALQPEAATPDCDQAFEEQYKCSARDPSNAGDLAIWRAGWAARGCSPEPCLPKFGARDTRCSRGTAGCVVVHEEVRT